jgi:hypothetical protein
VTEILSALADRGGRTSHVKFWDDMVTEILSALADRWPDSDKNTVSSADRGGRLATEILSDLADGGGRTSQDSGMVW